MSLPLHQEGNLQPWQPVLCQRYDFLDMVTRLNAIEANVKVPWAQPHGRGTVRKEISAVLSLS